MTALRPKYRLLHLKISSISNPPLEIQSRLLHDHSKALKGIAVKKLFAVISIAIGAFVTPALAETYACQYTDATGFIFQDGIYKKTGFDPNPPFFFKIEASKFDVSSHDYFKNYGTSTCLDFSPQHSCINSVGQSLYFNRDTNRGAIGSLYGASSEGTKRDTVSVSLFVCQTM